MPSQSARRGMSGGSSHRGGLGKLPKVLGLVAGLALVAWFFWGGQDGPDAIDRTSPDTLPPAPKAISDAGSAEAVPSLSTPSLGASSQASPPPPNPPRPTPSVAEADNPPPTRETPRPAPRPDPVTPPTPDSSPEIKPDPEVRRATRTAVAALPQTPSFTSGADAATLYNRGDKLIADGDLIGGRRVLSRLLFTDDAQLSARDATVIRNRLTDVNQDLFWSKRIDPDDPITGPYEVDTLLGPIAVKHRVPYQLLEIINGLKARNLQLGKTIKVVKGPIHARVIKHQFLMDLYALDPQGLPVFICSFPVGLGKNTPTGNWETIAGSKVVNPSWKDELNGDYFASDDPENPIGEYWIAIEGLDRANQNARGFGIHGTIEPDSIGKEESRGCIRLRDDDIALVFNMLTDHSQGSRLQIVP
jgi:hypothetical protein